MNDVNKSIQEMHEKFQQLGWEIQQRNGDSEKSGILVNWKLSKSN
jgi:hypothetical protein